MEYTIRLYIMYTYDTFKKKMFIPMYISQYNLPNT